MVLSLRAGFQSCNIQYKLTMPKLNRFSRSLKTWQFTGLFLNSGTYFELNNHWSYFVSSNARNDAKQSDFVHCQAGIIHTYIRAKAMIRSLETCITACYWAWYCARSCCSFPLKIYRSFAFTLTFHEYFWWFWHFGQMLLPICHLKLQTRKRWEDGEQKKPKI